ncbi:MAG: MCE family protein [Desulfovibrionaceae bacterium]|nr:MCE family protein [Desulfovibrionaceae bacterium]
MSKPASKTLIGAFVVGAIFLLCLALAVFGSGKLFKETYKAVVFFNGSLNGLNQGSPVVLRGVPIGRVTRIQVVTNSKGMSYRIPIFLELDSDKFDMPKGAVFDLVDGPDFLEDLLSRGFRARLASQSLLTGQLMVELDFFPQSEAGDFSGKVDYYEGRPIIPSIPSRMDSLMQRFNTLPIEQLTQNILDITDDLRTFLSRGEVEKTLAAVNRMIADFQSISGPMKQAVDSFTAFAKNSAKLSGNAGGMVSDFHARTNDLLNNLNASIVTLNATLKDARGLVAPASLPVLELTRTLRELSEAAKAIRSLANTLDHSPDAIIVGKGSSE